MILLWNNTVLNFISHRQKTRRTSTVPRTRRHHQTRPHVTDLPMKEHRLAASYKDTTMVTKMPLLKAFLSLSAGLWRASAFHWHGSDSPCVTDRELTLVKPPHSRNSVKTAKWVVDISNAAADSENRQQRHPSFIILYIHDGSEK